MNDEEKEISAEEVLKAMTGLQEGIRWLSYKAKDDYTIKKSNICKNNSILLSSMSRK